MDKTKALQVNVKKLLEEKLQDKKKLKELSERLAQFEKKYGQQNNET